MSRALRVERRSSPRKLPSECGWFVSARLRPARDVRLVDLSDRGALIEGMARLLPGAHIELHLFGVEGRRTVRARVVRSHVSALDWSSGVRYRAALEFDAHIAHGTLSEDRPAVRANDARAEGRQFPTGEPSDLQFE